MVPATLVAVVVAMARVIMMMMIALIRSRDQVCTSTSVKITFLHFVLSWVSSLHGRRTPLRLRLSDNTLKSSKIAFIQVH